MRISLTVTIAAVLVLGSAGAYLGNRLPIPAGALIGTLVGVGLAGGGSTLLGLPQPSLPPGIMALLQIALGMLVGLRMTREEIGSGARALLPASLLAVILIPASIAAALLAAYLTSISAVTAVFAAAPGGLTEMSAVNLGFGADGAAVAAVQLLRVLLILALINFLLKRLESRGKPESDDQDEEEQDAAEKTGYVEDLKRLGAALPWGIAGAVLGMVSQMPAGGIIGALVGAAAFRLITDRPVPVGKFQVGVQTLAGAVIGLNVSGDFLYELAQLAGAGTIIIATQMLVWLAMSWLLVKFFGYNVPTSALASSPGGFSGVIASSGEAGADPIIVTFIHLVRLSMIIIVVPIFVTLVFGN